MDIYLNKTYLGISFRYLSISFFYRAHILKHIFALSKISWVKSSYLIHKNHSPAPRPRPCPAPPNGPVRAFSTSMQQLFRCKLAV